MFICLLSLLLSEICSAEPSYSFDFLVAHDIVVDNVRILIVNAMQNAIEGYPNMALETLIGLIGMGLF